MQKWTNQNAGPIQCNRFNKAWNHLHFERNTYICLSGIAGVKESRSVQSTLGGSDPRKDVLEAMERIGEKFAWTVTAQNVNDILKAIEAETTAADDFLEWKPSQRYDRIVMNPPFEKQADIDHVRKAHKLLAPKGLLVSVMAPGFEFRSNRKSTDFREWLDDMGARVEDLPAESFKASGTNVSTKLVIVPAAATAPEQPAQSQAETVLQ